MSERISQEGTVKQQLQETHDSAKAEINQTLIEAGKGHLIDVVAVTSRELAATSDSETSTAGFERSQPGDEDSNTIKQSEDDPYASLARYVEEADAQEEAEAVRRQNEATENAKWFLKGPDTP